LSPQNEHESKHVADWNTGISSYIESGKLGKGLVPLKVFSGGIEEIPAALDYVRQGKNSGEKVVVTFK
jgi:hypothetical protein